MRVIVCGGRDYVDADAIRERLKQLQVVEPRAGPQSPLHQEHLPIRARQQLGYLVLEVR